MINQQFSTAALPANLVRVVADLKLRLQRHYEQVYPELAEIIRLVLDEEETNAWKLSYPHLLLPDLVEAHVARLNLQPAYTRSDYLQTSSGFTTAAHHLAAA